MQLESKWVLCETWPKSYIKGYAQPSKLMGVNMSTIMANTNREGSPSFGSNNLAVTRTEAHSEDCLKPLFFVISKYSS